MRRIRLAALGAVWALALSFLACGKGGDDEPAPPNPSQVPGRCTTPPPAADGPGDTSNYQPLSRGSWWSYQVIARRKSYDELLPEETTSWRQRVEVTGTRVVGELTATVFTITDFDDPARGTTELLLAKGASGVVRVPDAHADARAKAIGPHEILQFPFEPGRSFEQTRCDNLDLAVDADQDSAADLTDLSVQVTVVGEESISVPAGAFAAMRVDTRTWTTLQRSSGGSVASESVRRDWYAAGVGLVRSEAEDETGLVVREESLLGYHVDAAEGGLLELRSVTTGLAPPSPSTEIPGRPALAFDGTSHLLVSAVSTGAYEADTLRAHRVAADGTVGPALTPTTERGSGVRPAVAFNGTHYLVVTTAYRSSSDKLIGQRLTPEGELLDGAAGFVIPGNGAAGHTPALASDGTGWMLVRTESQVAGLRATAIGDDGSILGEVTLRAPYSSVAAAPAIAYGGGQYLVAWAEDASAIRGVRLSPDGSALDEEPLVIAEVGSPKRMGGVAWDGTRFLVTWTDARDPAGGGLSYDVYAARVAPDGAVLDGGGIVVNAAPGLSKLDPAVAAVPAGFIVTWWIDGYRAGAGIYAARVTGDGVLVDAPASGLGLEIARPTRYGSSLAHPVVARGSDGRSLIAWGQNDEVSGETKSLRSGVLAW